MFKNLKIIKLENRALLKIKGEDSKEFLQALVTNNINFISNEKSIYSALLSPQGKYLYDFFIFQDSKSNYLIIDCEKNSYQELMQKLNIYKLRSNVEITFQDTKDVYIVYGSDLIKFISNLKMAYQEGYTKNISDNLFFIDPRNKSLGLRVYSNNLSNEFKEIASGILSDWHYLRIKNNIPHPYTDLEKEKSFIIENNFEQINAIDFNKGCYIGQENTARQKYRGTAKRKLVKAKIIGKDVTNGEKIVFDNRAVGTIRSSSKDICLVSIRSEIYDKCKRDNIKIKINESELKFL